MIREGRATYGTVTIYRVLAVDLAHPDTVPRWLGVTGDKRRAERFADTQRAALDPLRWRVELLPVMRGGAR